MKTKIVKVWHVLQKITAVVHTHNNIVAYLAIAQKVVVEHLGMLHVLVVQIKDSSRNGQNQCFDDLLMLSIVTL